MKNNKTYKIILRKYSFIKTIAIISIILISYSEVHSQDDDHNFRKNSITGQIGAGLIIVFSNIYYERLFNTDIGVYPRIRIGTGVFAAYFSNYGKYIIVDYGMYFFKGKHHLEIDVKNYLFYQYKRPQYDYYGDLVYIKQAPWTGFNLGYRFQKPGGRVNAGIGMGKYSEGWVTVYFSVGRSF